SALIPWLVMRTTRPSKGSSLTTRLEPPATSSTGTPRSSDSVTAAISSPSVCASTRSAATPPIRSVVSSASRSSATRHRQQGLRHREDRRPLAGDVDRQGGEDPDRVLRIVLVILDGRRDLDLDGAVGGHHHRMGELAADLALVRGGEPGAYCVGHQTHRVH